MTWFPIGPDFVFAPRNPNFKRLSVRNELGRHGAMPFLAVDPTDPGIIYASVIRVGNALFRRRTDETDAWTCITDDLAQRNDNPHIEPWCLAINPVHPEHIYLGTNDSVGSAVYASTSRGDSGSWSGRAAVVNNPDPNFRMFKLVVDANTAADPASTVLYAATGDGIYRSADGGATWQTVFAAPTGQTILSFATTVSIASAAPHFYASVSNLGLFHSLDPTNRVPWVNLNCRNIGLPAHSGATNEEPYGNFSEIYVDYCQANPSVAYALLLKEQQGDPAWVGAGVYKTSSPVSRWSAITIQGDPPEGSLFGITPNSQGDDHDVLFVSPVGGHLLRSADGGRSWARVSVELHADVRFFTFGTPPSGDGTIPAVYVGCDGGIGMSSRLADPTYDVTTDPGVYNEGDSYDPTSGVWQNFNHGMQSSAVRSYATDPALSPIGYIGCWDDGIAASAGALGWRGIADNDIDDVATAPGPNGVNVWAHYGIWNSWPASRLGSWTDIGDFSPAFRDVRLDGDGSLLDEASYLRPGLDGNCLVGAIVRDSERTLAAGIPAPANPQAAQTATLSSMDGVGVGTVLVVDDGDNQEAVPVTATTSTTVTGVFTKAHAAGAAVQIERGFVATIDGDGVARQISQDFHQNGPNVKIVAAGANRQLYCVTTDDVLWTTDASTGLSSSTRWTSMTKGQPPGGISDVAVTNGGDVYVLFGHAPAGGGGSPSSITPLFKVASDSWTAQPSVHLPATGGFGRLVADPVDDYALYESSGPHVYGLRLTGGSWQWTDLSDGLPGQDVQSLWAGNLARNGTPKVVLRAAVGARGVWERDVTAGATAPAIALYLRDHLLDEGWVSPSPEGLPDPYSPGDNVWHWESPDIKVDSRQRAADGTPYYQNDPESSLPITHVGFDQLRDNSTNVTGAGAARLHVQVHNRSWTPATQVKVWAILCNAAAGVPTLSASSANANNFDFWSQFRDSGDVVPQLPPDSPWQSIGPPQTLDPIDAATPRVASWEWVAPDLGSDDPGHYCVLAFVHSARNPIRTAGETGVDVDSITAANPQIAQKNLHIGPPLPSGPGDAPPGGPATGGGPSTQMRAYVEFHNPTRTTRKTTLVFDLRGLPDQLAVTFELAGVGPNPTLKGVRRVVHPKLPRQVLTRMQDLLRSLGERLGRTRRRHGPTFDPAVYEAIPSGVVEVVGFPLEPFGFGAALLTTRNRGTLPPGKRYRLPVQQVVNAKVVGGSTFIIRTAGEARAPRPIVPDYW